LETFSGTFSGKSTGSGTGNTKEAAEAAALNASNKNLFAEILKKLSELLDETKLASKVIQNFIDNNVKAKVKVYKLLKLKAIASSTDGVNYILNKGARIKEDQYVTIEKGQTLVGPPGIPFTNDGYLQIDGHFYMGGSSSKALKTAVTTPYENNGIFTFNGGSYIDTSILFTNNYAAFVNSDLYIYGTLQCGVDSLFDTSYYTSATYIKKGGTFSCIRPCSIVTGRNLFNNEGGTYSCPPF
jgi:hypothetical protein